MSEKIGKTLDRVSMILDKERTEMKIARMNTKAQLDLYNKLKLNKAPPQMYFEQGEERVIVRGHFMPDRQLANEVQIRHGNYPRLVKEEEVAEYSTSLALFYVYVSGEQNVPEQIYETFTKNHSNKLLVQVAQLDGYQQGQLVVYRDGQKEASQPEENAADFIQKTFVGPLVALDNSMVEYLMDLKGKALIVFMKPEDQLTMDQLKEVSKTIRLSGLVVIHSQTTQGLGRKVANFMGVDSTALPHAVIADASQVEHAVDMKKYHLRANITPASLLLFASQFLQGLLKQEFHSEPVGLSQERGVNVYVGSNFRQGVFNPHQATFLVIYSPNTGLTKILMPEVEKLALALKGFDGVQVCKINGQENELDGVIYHGFPSIKFIAAGSDQAIEYEEGLSVQDILDYMMVNVQGLKQFLDNKKEEIKQEL